MIGRIGIILTLLLAQLPATIAQECSNDAIASIRTDWRLPRSSPSLQDTIGHDEAKVVLKEAIITPASVEVDLARLFIQTYDQSAVLLCGPAGSGKVSLAEAAAAAIDARILLLPADEASKRPFCSEALEAVKSNKSSMIIIESLEVAPAVSLQIRRCTRELALAASPWKVSFVATMDRSPSTLTHAQLASFGYIAESQLPNAYHRQQFLLRIFQRVARLDAKWGSSIREAAVQTLVGLTENYTLSEIELVVRRTFLNCPVLEEGARDPVLLHHFEKVIGETVPRAARFLNNVLPDATSDATRAKANIAVPPPTKGYQRNARNRSKDGKDPMDGVFGWCNFWLPEALHLPAVVWAMILFGILAHFMARSMYQPYGSRKKRGGSQGGRSASLFGDVGVGGGGAHFPPFGADNDWKFPKSHGLGSLPDASDDDCPSNFFPPPSLETLESVEPVKAPANETAGASLPRSLTTAVPKSFKPPVVKDVKARNDLTTSATPTSATPATR